MTPTWANRYQTEILSAGHTTIIVLDRGGHGWKVRAWTREIGQPRTQAEGQLFFEQTYGGFDEAYQAYSEIGMEALEHPRRFIDNDTVLVDRDTQIRIDSAASRDAFEEVSRELDSKPKKGKRKVKR